MRTLYLDYNATTPIAPNVQQSMLPFLAEHYGDPSSGHALGRACHEAVEDARTRLASLLGADRDEIIFTSGSTESCNRQSREWRFVGGWRGHLVISAFEHAAVTEPVRFLTTLGYKVTVVGADVRGVVNLEEVAEALRHDTFLVSVMHANHEIGVIQPIRRIVSLCQDRGILVHTDAAQSVGKIPVQVKELGVDLLSLSGHKFYAPKGIGALFVRRGTPIASVMYGAGQERGLRPGIENVASVIGLGEAALLVQRPMAEAGQRMSRLRSLLFDKLRAAIGDRLSMNGVGAEQLPNTLSVNFPGVNGSDLLRRTPEILGSTGAAGHSGAGRISSTLAAIGLTPETAAGTVRLSLGWYTTEDEIERAANALISAWESAQ